MKTTNIDELSIAALRSLCIDEINTAKSGHPGVALDAAPILYTLYKYHLNVDPKHPEWFNRDRFVLSSGHGSSLLYALLHTSGYQISMDDLKNFRQLNAITTGHPEYKVTPGVDASSGPLGQGLAQAVGIALAERMVKAQYPNGEILCNHYTYCLLGDGDLEEGISQEAISFAGHQRLNKLIVFYDSNNVTLDGSLSLSFSEEVRLRFLASNWNVIKVNDGNSVKEINNAIIKAKKNKDFPTLIIVNTIIGYGSAKQGTNKVHGAPLGVEDGKHAKDVYNYHYPDFTVPNEVYESFKATIGVRGAQQYKEYVKNLEKYKNEHPKEFEIFNDALSLNTGKYLKDDVKFTPDNNDATRKTSNILLNKFAKEIPFLVGGAADVASSVMTKIYDGGEQTFDNPKGRNISYGIREFLASSVMNGILLHQGLRTYIGSFLVFSDYMKSSIRLAALSKLPGIYVFSHDSIYVGEDGPTHQPVDQLAMLRSIPNVTVIRPADANETYGAYQVALSTLDRPTCLILSRQGLKLLKDSSANKVRTGAYIICKEKSKKFITIISSGSEVSVALEAKELLAKNKIDTRVVSMPSMELFNKLSLKEQKDILGPDYNKRVAVEALTSFGWHRYAPNVLAMDSFGLSGKNNELIKYFHLTSQDIVELVKKVAKDVNE